MTDGDDIGGVHLGGCWKHVYVGDHWEKTGGENDGTKDGTGREVGGDDIRRVQLS